MSDLRPLDDSKQALMHAEAVLLVDHRKAEIAEHDAVLEQGMGADDDVDRPGCQVGENGLALLAFFASGEDLDTQAGCLGERRDGGEVLTGEDFGRGHHRRLRSRLDGVGHGEQRNDGLAGADIALQQPQHAVGLGHVGADFVQRTALRGGQFMAEGGAYPGGGFARTVQHAAGRFLEAAADKTERQLAGQQLVIGEPAPCHALRCDIRFVARCVHVCDRLGEGRKAVAHRDMRIGPFVEIGHALQGAGYRLADDLQRHA